MELESASTKAKTNVLPEVEIYLTLLVIIFLLDKKRTEKVWQSASDFTFILIQASLMTASAMTRIQLLNRRTMDSLAAMMLFYHSLFFERQNKMAECRP